MQAGGFFGSFHVPKFPRMELIGSPVSENNPSRQLVNKDNPPPLRQARSVSCFVSCSTYMPSCL